jgi:hypothetical protein
MKNLSTDASAYLQSGFKQDAETIESWFKTVKSAYPYLHSFSLGFLQIAMGGLESALLSGLSADEWAKETAKDNAHLLVEN